MNILVLSTEEYLTLRLLKCLAPLDAKVYVLGAGPCPALQASRHCRRYDALAADSLSGMAENLRVDLDHYCRRHAIDVILPSGMRSSFLLTGLKDSFSAARILPLPSLEQLQWLHNKWTFSRFLAQQGLPFPSSRLIERVGDVTALDLPFPVIVKPLELDAGRGVVRCDSREDVAAHVRRYSHVLPLLVQEYIPGVDVGLGLLAQDGVVLAWSIQKQRADCGGVEFIRHEGVLEIGRKIMAACHYNGIAHFDLRIDSRNNSIQLLECNPRFWASLPFCLLAGVNYADLAVRLTLGQPLPEMLYNPVGITFPSKVLTGALRGVGWRISEPSRQALRVTLSDPLPQLFLGAGRIRRRAASVFAGRTQING